MEYYGFRYHDIYFPKEVKYLDRVEYHHVKWGISWATRGLVFECKNQVVKLVDDDIGLEWYSVMGTVGFTSGTHFWSFEIVDGCDVMIGICNKIPLSVSNFPGFGPGITEKGVSYNGSTGRRYLKHENRSFGPTFGKGDVIGTLLNMNHKTVTFYKNGVRVGTAASSVTLGALTYYPCIALSSTCQEVRSIGHNKIFT